MNATDLIENASETATGASNALSSGITNFQLLEPLMILTFIPLAAVFIAYALRQGLHRKSMVFLFVRLSILLLLCIAASSPVYVTISESIGEATPITVLVDSSTSMKLYSESGAVGYAIFDRLKSDIGNLTGDNSKVKIEFFSPGNYTGIGDALYNSFVQYNGEPQSIILISDGLENTGRDATDIAKIFTYTNSTIDCLKPEKAGNDIILYDVLGDNKVPTNIKYPLRIQVVNTGFTGSFYRIKVSVDGNEMFSKTFTQSEVLKDIPLDMTLKGIGLHEIKVVLINDEDVFLENNVFYKSVEVVEKPKILVVSESTNSPLLNILDELYDVDVTSRVDNDYSKYAAVLMDDIHSRELERNRVNNLKKYILDGNGVGFFGGKNSFEYGGYNNSFVETILPVSSEDKPSDRRKDFAILLLMDISKSFQYGQGMDSKLDVEKAVALGILRALNANDTVGVIAFNNNAYVISPMSPLGPKYNELEDKILRLKDSGGTVLAPALELSDSQLSRFTTNKYLIILSDGNFQSTRAQTYFNKLADMRDRDIKTFTVGIGFDTRENLMQDMANYGGGTYFSLKSNPERRLKLIFGDEDDDKSKEGTPVVLTDEFHYITRDLTELESSGAKVKEINKVSEKKVANLLLSTKGGKPILTAWNFGLGRVVAFTTDNGKLWSQEIMEADSGKVISAMTNWLIGDLEKGKKVRVASTDIHLGETAYLKITSDDRPKVESKNYKTLQEADIMITRTSIKNYVGEFTPNAAGFWGIRASSPLGEDLDIMAVNYPLEYSRLTMDEDLLRRIATHTGGTLYDTRQINDLIESIIERAKKNSTREVIDLAQLWQYFAAAALIIYFLDVVVRRMFVIWQRYKKEL